MPASGWRREGTGLSFSAQCCFGFPLVFTSTFFTQSAHSSLDIFIHGLITLQQCSGFGSVLLHDVTDIILSFYSPSLPIIFKLGSAYGWFSFRDYLPKKISRKHF